VKQVEVTIMGHGYILGCPEGGESLLAQAVASVDQEMSTIRDSGKVKARERIAVLAALNLAYQLAEAASRAPVAAPNPAIARDNGAASDAPDLDLDGLLQRVDAALGDDGQLL
jgi:cell division protein ZapA